MEWQKINDGITRMNVYWYGEYRSFCNVLGHGIEIFSEKVDTGKTKLYFGRNGCCRDVKIKAVLHTIVIRSGPYGETVDEKIMPFGTTIAQAKQTAIALAHEVNTFYDEKPFNI